jgi:prepilin-type processing-associated H-X9-DG protein
VELLVVIGIIAVLVSILLPSLARARAQANLIYCESNFRQVYSALLFYGQDNGGYLPRCADGDWSEPYLEADIAFTLTQYLNSSTPKTTGGEPYGPIAQALLCVDRIEDPSLCWFPSVKNTLKWNPRAFPGADQNGTWTMSLPDGSSAIVRDVYPQRKLASIRNSSEKMAFWEGGQILGWNLCTEPSATNLDGWRWYWGADVRAHMYLDPPFPGYDMVNEWSIPIRLGSGDHPEREPEGWWQCPIRTRHLNNTVTPVCFFDGHVESRKINEILVRDICINR